MIKSNIFGHIEQVWLYDITEEYTDDIVRYLFQ